MEDENPSKEPLEPQEPNPPPEPVEPQEPSEPGEEIAPPQNWEESLPPIFKPSEPLKEERTMAESYPTPPVIETPPPAKNNTRTIIIIVVVALVLLCCCCLGSLALIFGPLATTFGVDPMYSFVPVLSLL